VKETKIYHLDHGGDVAEMQRINTAYAELKAA
jgi:hypothetical protein